MIEFLVYKREPPTKFLHKTKQVYGKAATSYSTVKKLVSRIKGKEEDPGLSDLWDRQRSGQSSSVKIAESLLMALLTSWNKQPKKGVNIMGI